MSVLRTIAFIAAVTAATSAHAQDDEPDFTFGGYVAVSNDYRDRGLTLSDGDISVYGSLSVFHKSGFYAGVDAALSDDTFGRDQKTEFYVGYSFDKGVYAYDFSFELEGFYGNSDAYYPEIKASISRDFGLAFIRGGAAFAPEGRWNTPGVDSLYTYADLDIPVPTLPALTFISHVGYDFRDGRSDLFDWSIGFSAVLDPVEISLTYEDSSLDQRIGNGAVILGFRAYF
ncbi:MAG: hypothetical protein COB37_12095 [Kordiimonadales bacterium]|nr:MAG: hypothetical protein COB37_12095 [Kordiimonadales bacterium]